MQAAREAAGLTLRGLAAISGVSHEAIWCIERGHRQGRVDTIELLADALCMSIDEYIGHEVMS